MHVNGIEHCFRRLYIIFDNMESYREFTKIISKVTFSVKSKVLETKKGVDSLTAFKYHCFAPSTHLSPMFNIIFHRSHVSFIFPMYTIYHTCIQSMQKIANNGFLKRVKDISPAVWTKKKVPYGSFRFVGDQEMNFPFFSDMTSPCFLNNEERVLHTSYSFIHTSTLDLSYE